MSDNIVRFRRPARPDDKNAANIQEMMRQWNDRAQRGDISAVAIVATDAEGHVHTEYAFCNTTQGFIIAGATKWLDARIIDDIRAEFVQDDG